MGISIVLLISEQRLQILFPIPADLNIFWHLRQGLSFVTSEVVLGRGDMKHEFLSVSLGLSDIVILRETHLSRLASLVTPFDFRPTWDTGFQFGLVTSEARPVKREILRNGVVESSTCCIFSSINHLDTCRARRLLLKCYLLD